MQNFIDHRIPLRASRQFRRVATSNTEETPMDNGESAFNARWKYPKMKYFANYALVSEDAQLEIASAFHAAWARLLLIRFRDYGDFRVLNSPLAPAVGTRTPIQLTKRYYYGPSYRDRLLQAVDVAVIARDGTPVAGVLDKQLGLFTPDSNWAAGAHTWSGSYCVWVRFASDELDMTMVTLDIATSDVELHEGRAFR